MNVHLERSNEVQDPKAAESVKTIYCPACRGEGVNSRAGVDYQPCGRCDGRGRIWVEQGDA